MSEELKAPYAKLAQAAAKEYADFILDVIERRAKNLEPKLE